MAFLELAMCSLKPAFFSMPFACSNVTLSPILLSTVIQPNVADPFYLWSLPIFCEIPNEAFYSFPTTPKRDSPKRVEQTDAWSKSLRMPLQHLSTGRPCLGHYPHQWPIFNSSDRLRYPLRISYLFHPTRPCGNIAEGSMRVYYLRRTRSREIRAPSFCSSAI